MNARPVRALAGPLLLVASGASMPKAHTGLVR